MDDIQWLKDLNRDLWPEGQKKHNGPGMVAYRVLTTKEIQEITRIIEERRLLTYMISTSMFGGYGMEVFAHPEFPGLPPEYLLAVIEDHLPRHTRYDELTDRPIPEKKPGRGREDAWILFSRYTHSEQNREWLKQYHMRPPQHRNYYDY